MKTMLKVLFLISKEIIGAVLLSLLLGVYLTFTAIGVMDVCKGLHSWKFVILVQAASGVFVFVSSFILTIYKRHRAKKYMDKIKEHAKDMENK